MAKSVVAATTPAQNFLQKVDVGYSYQLAKKMEEFKTNAALGYRTGGSEAEFLTGEMLFAEMQKIGLQEVSKDAFSLDSWEFEKAKLSFCMPNGTPCQMELGGYQANLDTCGPRDYELLYGGRGTASDLAHLDVAGRLVLIDINQRDEWWINYPAYQAHLHGAAAVIAVQDDGYAKIDSTALNSQDICGPASAPAFSMSQAHAALLRQKLASSQSGVVHVTLDARSLVRPNATSYNIVGKIPGRNPNSMLLMSAHYDSYFAGFQDDNAAVALMMGIAKALLQSGYRPEKTLVFCAMAAEEWGISDTRYDWSVGAYNQVFRVHPDWVGKVMANINFELPAHAHDTQDVIRCVYELQPYLQAFAATVPTDPCVYPDGVCVVSPVLTWSDDFSIALAGIPSLVNDFASGGFMQTHYHSQFDNDDAYDEASYRFHHALYGLLMLAYDHCAVPPLNFSPRLTALRDSLDPFPMMSQGVNPEKLTRALNSAIALSEELYTRVCTQNSAYEAALSLGKTQVAQSIFKTAQPLAQTLLKAFRFAEDSFVRLTWHDEPIFPHQHPQNNLACLAGAQSALSAGNLARALDPFLAEIDNNWYAFHFDNAVFRHFSDYVLHQSPDRLMWGAGRVLGQEDLSRTVRLLLHKKKHPGPPVTEELAALKLAQTHQQALLAKLIARETRDVEALCTLLRSAM